MAVLECLSDMYGKCRSVEDTRQNFGKMVDKGLCILDSSDR